MKSPAIGLLGVLLVGFLGWLAAGASGMTGYVLLSWAAIVGAIGGVLSRRLAHLPGLWLGIAFAYPAFLALGIVAFFGENSMTYAVLVLLVATLGFIAATLLLRAVAMRRPLP